MQLMKWCIAIAGLIYCRRDVSNFTSFYIISQLGSDVLVSGPVGPNEHPGLWRFEEWSGQPFLVNHRLCGREAENCQF
jgi:hypothetical protein